MSKKIVKFLFVLAIIFQIVLVPSTFADGDNLVKNPGFEDTDGNDAHFWLFDCYTGDFSSTLHSIDTAVGYEGKSAFIQNNREDDSRYKQVISTEGNSYYRMSCWVKTENVGTEMKGANLSVEGSVETSRDIRGTSENWEYLELYGKTAANQDRFTLTVGLGGYGNINTGKAWFDNVEVVKLDSLPPGKTAINLDPYNEFGSGSNSSDSSGEKGQNNLLLILVIIAIVITISFIFYILFKDKLTVSPSNTIEKKDSTDKDKQSSGGVIEKIKVKFDRIDFIIMAAMTVVYLAIALVNLGDFKVPTTSWTPSMPGDSFTVDLGKEATMSRIYFYIGLGKAKDPTGKFRVEYLDENQDYKHLITFEKKDMFMWKFIDTPPVKTRKLKFIVDTVGASLNEICILESGSTEPIKEIKIEEKSVNSKEKGSVENLFDEQHLFTFYPSYKNSMYFDEIYHARTAYEYIIHMEPYEDTHPPLGKIFIAIGILIFGMVPFGWRIMGTLFGVAMVPAMYAFGKKIFHNRFYAFCSAFLMMFDCMHYTQTRIATIDSYVTLFVILMYYYMYDYFVNKSYAFELKESLKPLFLSGLFFGFGAASKWIAVYGAAGLALLFFLSKSTEFYEYKKLSGKKLKNNHWAKRYPSNLTTTLLCCVLFFIIIPGVIYFLSYIPWMMVPGRATDFDLFITNSQSMLSYHKDLVDTHPYQSPWWEWPFIKYPMAFYAAPNDHLPFGLASKIITMGNPAVWWVGILAFLTVTVWALSKLNKNLVMLFVLSTLSFAYVAVPKDFIAIKYIIQNNFDIWWVAIFLVLALIVVITSKFDITVIINSIISSTAFIAVVLGFKNVVKDRNYYVSMSTQSVIWICLLISITLLFWGMYRYDKKMLVVLAAMIFQYVPWIAVPRIAFIYHYFSIVPFLILTIVYVMKKLNDRFSDTKYLSFVYLGVVMVLFMLFYPGISGMVVPSSYMKFLKWFDRWYF